MTNAKGGDRLLLVVTHGRDLGERVELDRTPRVVGRASDAALPLTDPAVSRRHVEVFVLDGNAVVRTVSGAAPFVFAGRQETSATVPLHGTFAIGGTMLAIAAAPDLRDDPAPAAESTEVHRLLEGVGADVRGLGDVFSLLESLDSVTTEEEATTSFSAWAVRSVGATNVRATEEVDGSATSSKRGAVVVAREGDRGATVLVPGDGISVFLRMPLAPTEIALPVKRLIAVGARMFLQRLSALRDLSRAREDGALLRTQALGSASDFLGTSDGAREVTRLLPRLAASDATVLILGESGSGKSFVGRLIHESSPRATAPLRVVNCAAIPDNLVESALFGHERGAFTGADAARPGVFEVAGKGTVLLDEIGELPMASQAKLLRVLEDCTFERVGSTKAIPLRARVIAATNRDLAGAVAEGTFRNDLFFRVSVVSVRVPPLRERAADIPMLAERILADLAASSGRRITGFTQESMRVLSLYSWPGNVRELRNAIEHAIVLGDGPSIAPSDLPAALRTAAKERRTRIDDDSDVVELPARLEWLEGRAIEAALRASGGNRTRAAAILGINRVTLYKKLKEPDSR